MPKDYEWVVILIVKLSINKIVDAGVYLRKNSQEKFGQGGEEGGRWGQGLVGGGRGGKGREGDEREISMTRIVVR